MWHEQKRREQDRQSLLECTAYRLYNNTKIMFCTRSPKNLYITFYVLIKIQTTILNLSGYNIVLICVLHNIVFNVLSHNKNCCYKIHIYGMYLLIW